MKKLITILCLCLFWGSCEKSIDIKSVVERYDLTYEVNSQSPYTGEVIDVYNNGQRRSQINYKDGKKHGRYIEYYKNGQLMWEGNYKDNKKHDTWIYREEGQGERWKEKGYDQKYLNGKKRGKRSYWIINKKGDKYIGDIEHIQ